jgi:hypothetical protein
VRQLVLLRNCYVTDSNLPVEQVEVRQLVLLRNCYVTDSNLPVEPEEVCQLVLVVVGKLVRIHCRRPAWGSRYTFRVWRLGFEV